LAKLMDSQIQRGVIVADVVIGSAAMNADMRRGDIIVKLNDQRVSNTAELEATIQAAKSPGRMRLELIKKGKPTTVVIDLP
jgi:S1-C subfamily serine protease